MWRPWLQYVSTILLWNWGSCSIGIPFIVSVPLRSSDVFYFHVSEIPSVRFTKCETIQREDFREPGTNYDFLLYIIYYVRVFKSEITLSSHLVSSLVTNSKESLCNFNDHFENPTSEICFSDFLQYNLSFTKRDAFGSISILHLFIFYQCHYYICKFLWITGEFIVLNRIKWIVLSPFKCMA